MSTSGGSIGGASISSLWNDPTLMGQLLGGVNVQGLQGVLQAQEAQVSAPLSQLSAQQSTLSAQGQAFSAIQGALQKVLTDAQGLQTSSAFNQTAVPVSSNQTVATASGAGGPYGDYALVVSSLATPASVNSAFQPGSASTALGWNGTVQITVHVGIPPTTTAIVVKVPVVATDTLTNVAQNIQSAAANALPAGTQLSAVVLPTMQSGVAGSALSLNVNGGLTSSDITTSGTVPNLGFTNGSTFSQAVYTLNGVQNQSSTNTVTGALPGVSLNLLATGSTNLSISQNPGATATQMGALVTDVQSAVQTIGQYTGQGQALAGNAALTNLVGQMQSTLTGMNQSQGAGFQSLTDLGLSISYSQATGGTIAFDPTAFTNALQSNPQAVQSLVTGTSGVAGQLATLVQNVTQPSTGVIASYLQGIQGQESLLSSQESALQQSVTLQQTQLQNQFSVYLQQIANNVSQQSFLGQYVALQSGQSTSGSGSSGGTTAGG